jgi:hypothetical protein
MFCQFPAHGLPTGCAASELAALDSERRSGGTNFARSRPEIVSVTFSKIRGSAKHLEQR